jgi:hypothetical protein
MSDSTPRLNRVDPFGDLHRVSERGMFTGNRGCLVDEAGKVVRHHRGQLWITCVTAYRNWRSPLDEPGHWTPLFFLDDAVALAAGHRPCGLCRRDDYLSYRDAVQRGLGMVNRPSATDLNRMLAVERLRRGRGLSRAGDRKTWTADFGQLPYGTVIVGPEQRAVVIARQLLFLFSFDGWEAWKESPGTGPVQVLTPPMSVAALGHGYGPRLHHSVDQ